MSGELLLQAVEGADTIQAHVDTLADYQRKFRVQVLALRLREQRQEHPIAVDINVKRWIVHCPCGGGVAAHLRWTWAGCLDCGRCWTRLVFPTAQEMEALDAVLSLRPRGSSYYSWTHGQSADDLRRENARHGWPVSSDVWV